MAQQVYETGTDELVAFVDYRVQAAVSAGAGKFEFMTCLLEALRQDLGEVQRSDTTINMHLVGDSRLATNQTNGIWRCNVPRLIPLWAGILHLLCAHFDVGIHVYLDSRPRALNIRTDALSKIAIHESKFAHASVEHEACSHNSDISELMMVPQKIWNCEGEQVGP